MKIRLFNQEDLNYVEFTVLDTRKPYRRHSADARFLQAPVFSVIQYVFELSNNDYSYYDAVRYNDGSLDSLRHHLQSHIKHLHSVSSSSQLEAFALKQIEGFDFMNEMKTFYPNWRISWENFRDQLIQVSLDLLEMVDQCIEEERVLWVKGY